MTAYTPLSVREGNRRKKIAWWLKGQRETLALRIAPWLRTNGVSYHVSKRPLDSYYTLDELGRAKEIWTEDAIKRAMKGE